MSAPGTVVATSAEGAGDMPSLDPPSGAGAPGDGAPTFSEVLSLSSPDLPNPSGTSGPSSAPPDLHAGEPPANAAPTTTTEGPPPVRTGFAGRRGQRQADPAEAHTRDGGGKTDATGATGTPGLVADRSTPTGEVPPPAPARTPSPVGTDGVESEQSGATALSWAPVPTPATNSAAQAPTAATSSVLTTGEIGIAGPGAPARLDPTVPEDGPVQSNAGAQNKSPSDVPSQSSDTAAGVTPPGRGDRPDQGSIRSDTGSAVRVTDFAATGSADGRVSADRAAPLRGNVLHGESEPVQAPGSSTGVLPLAPSTADVAIAAESGSMDEAPGVPEFPGGGVPAGLPSVDVSDLAASISRPLAGGGGEYSVQVSLHPPELGEVRALLSLQGDVLHVTLTPEHASGFQALSDAMPALHEQLAGGGVEVNVTLGQPGDAQGEEGRRPADSGSSANSASDGPTPVVTPPATARNSGSRGWIDLVL